jgi:hypothetical protein
MRMFESIRIFITPSISLRTSATRLLNILDTLNARFRALHQSSHTLKGVFIRTQRSSS